MSKADVIEVEGVGQPLEQAMNFWSKSRQPMV